MTSRKLPPLAFTDLINESDESDNEYIPLHCGIPFDDLRSEIDIARYYRRISSDNMCNELRSRRRKTSKSVQTDPDVSNLPPSWLLRGEKLVDELYTGLGNIINVMDHNPESNSQQDARKQSDMDPMRMKYFTYENGYWKSTLLPNIKIPDRVETDRQNRALCSDTTRKTLRHLLEVATKLRNIIPYLANCEPYQDPQILEDKDKLRANENSTRKIKRSKSPCGGDCLSDDDMDLTGVSGETTSDSGKSSKCSPEYCGVEKHKTKRMKKNHYNMESLNRRNVKSDESSLPNQIPGVQVSRYTYSKQTASSICTQMSKPGVSRIPHLRKRNVKAENTESLHIVGKSTSVTLPTSTKIVAGCSYDFKFANKGKDQSEDTVAKPSGEKRSLFEKESNAKNKAHQGSSQKDFIRRNIMALKNQANRVGSSAGRNDRNYNADAEGTSQSRNRRIPHTLK